MEQKQRVIRLAAAVLACLLAIPLVIRVAEPAAAFFSVPGTAAALLRLETGRQVIPQATAATQTTAAVLETAETQAPAQQAAVFRPEDADLVQLYRACGYAVDVEAMLMETLHWELSGTAPTVLILHSHATESYTQSDADRYVATAAYRTADPDHNMLRIGETVRQVLEANGVGVIHDTALHDYPSYPAAYANSRRSIQSYLEAYPSICLVLDLHRDAIEAADGTQLAPSVELDGRQTAQLMLVVGSDAGGLQHPGWQQNLSLAVKLQVQLEKRSPGLCRPISFRTERFNQDLCPGALLVEVGTAGNTLEESLAAAELLAQGILDLSAGSATEDSTS